MRSRALLALGLLAVVAGTVIYVVRTTNRPVAVHIGTAAADAFDRNGRLDPGASRALFSPDGNRLATIGRTGIGLARAGRIQLVTPPGSNAVDAAWMPDSRSLLVAEGPADTERLTVLDLDGNPRGVAQLDAPLSVGRGNGLTVDRRGARAVTVAETRDPIGGRRRFDLVLIDLETGHVVKLTETADVDETWPVFLDDNRVLFARSDGVAPAVVMELDLTSRTQRRLSPTGETAQPVGVARGAIPVYASGRSNERVSVWAVLGQGRRVRLGRLSGGAVAWSVDPSGRVAVVTAAISTDGAERITILRAVTLQPPPSR